MKLLGMRRGRQLCCCPVQPPRRSAAPGRTPFDCPSLPATLPATFSSLFLLSLGPLPTALSCPRAPAPAHTQSEFPWPRTSAMAAACRPHQHCCNPLRSLDTTAMSRGGTLQQRADSEGVAEYSRRRCRRPAGLRPARWARGSSAAPSGQRQRKQEWYAATWTRPLAAPAMAAAGAGLAMHGRPPLLARGLAGGAGWGSAASGCLTSWARPPQEPSPSSRRPKFSLRSKCPPEEEQAQRGQGSSGGRKMVGALARVRTTSSALPPAPHCISRRLATTQAPSRQGPGHAEPACLPRPPCPTPPPRSRCSPPILRAQGTQSAQHHWDARPPRFMQPAACWMNECAVGSMGSTPGSGSGSHQSGTQGEAKLTCSSFHLLRHETGAQQGAGQESQHTCACRGASPRRRLGGAAVQHCQLTQFPSAPPRHSASPLHARLHSRVAAQNVGG